MLTMCADRWDGEDAEREWIWKSLREGASLLNVTHTTIIDSADGAEFDE